MAEVEIINANYIDEKTSYNKKLKKKVCAYCRVSTDLEDQKTSYHSQITHYSDYIKKNKDWIFVGIYADEGITGTQIKNREQFIRMIDDCKLGKIDIIIAKSISRFARNTVDTLNTVRLLRGLNIDVYFEKENIHTINMDSEMFLTLYSAFAQAESESTSMNVKLGYRAKMKRGEPVGQAACYGYIWDTVNKKLIINEEEANIIRMIFNYYISGLGTTRIATELTKKNILTPKGCKTWGACVIRNIIRNVKYVGDLCGQIYYVENPITHKQLRNRGQKPKYYVRNHHEPIVARDIFEKAQKIYSERSIKIKEGKTYCEKFSLRYTFSSMIYCEKCGNRYVRRINNYINKDGVKHEHIYWACSTNINKGSCKEAVTIREEELKSLFLALYNKFLNCSRDEDLIKKIRNTIARDNSETKIKNIDIKINQTKKKMSKLIDLNINNEINNEVFESKNNELSSELEEYNNLKEELLNNKNRIAKEEKRLKLIEKELINTKTIHTFDDEVFKKLIKKIIIGDYNEDGSYNPNVIKFVLNITNNDDDDSQIKFLSLEIDERNHSSKGL